METPSSTKRITRSQTHSLGLNNSNIPMSRKMEDSAKASVKQQQQERSVLIDITNDSPIVGLAKGIWETPSSATAKQRSNILKNSNKTPGSGEALLRGQVKTLLQRVEEEADQSKIGLENRPFLRLQGLLDSNPMRLLAPTPANTPMVLDDLTHNNNSIIQQISPVPVIEEQLKICEAVVSEMFKQEALESQKSLNRQLLMDFSEKSESDSSPECFLAAIAGTESGSEQKSLSPQSEVADDDSASLWSIQVNASTHDDEDLDEVIGVVEVEELYDDDYSEDEEEERYGDRGLAVDELCEGITRMSMVAVKFSGKHKRFEYNSDDELLEKEEECEG
ncbi:unnamed protein product [Linum tenue]|uniref:Uncharacterized protein n=1 Tax=Linum tenue TaxID=586396 RepID=A0AAV0JNH4_9ROSI|nr:unnamed protein product [Linum tenue]